MSGHDKFAIFTKKLVIKPLRQGKGTLIFADSHVTYPPPSLIIVFGSFLFGQLNCGQEHMRI